MPKYCFYFSDWPVFFYAVSPMVDRRCFSFFIVADCFVIADIESDMFVGIVVFFPDDDTSDFWFFYSLPARLL